MDDATELELPDDGPGPQDQAEQAEAQQTARRALGQLSEEHRQVLLLRYMQELDYAEIAAARGVAMYPHEIDIGLLVVGETDHAIAANRDMASAALSG